MEDDERDALIIYFVSYALLNYLVHKGKNKKKHSKKTYEKLTIKYVI